MARFLKGVMAYKADHRQARMSRVADRGATCYDFA
jgi:hypothetical protein